MSSPPSSPMLQLQGPKGHRLLSDVICALREVPSAPPLHFQPHLLQEASPAVPAPGRESRGHLWASSLSYKALKNLAPASSL